MEMTCPVAILNLAANLVRAQGKTIKSAFAG